MQINRLCSVLFVLGCATFVGVAGLSVGCSKRHAEQTAHDKSAALPKTTRVEAAQKTAKRPVRVVYYAIPG